MAEESTGIPSDPDEVTAQKATQDIQDIIAEPVATEEYSVRPPIPRFSRITHILARTAGSIEDSLLWLISGKARLSVAVGFFAALMTAIGFSRFDAQREQWMLEQTYPNAVSLDDRYVLYARDLIDERRYPEAESILEELMDRRDAGEGLRADALFLFGTCLVESNAGDASADEGRRALDRFIGRFPTDPRVVRAHGAIAESLADSGLYDDSISRCKRLLRMPLDETERAEIEFLIARNYYATGYRSAAMTALERLRQDHSDTARAHDATILLAKALVKSGRNERAEDMLKKLAAQEPGGPHASAALLMLADNCAAEGQQKRAIDYCRRWFRESSTVWHQFDVMLTLAGAKLESGLPQEALVLASDASASFPGSPGLARASVLKGRAYETLGKLEKAELSYLRAGELDETSYAPYWQLARMRSSEENWSEAARFMERAVEIEPGEDILWFELTKLYRRNEDYGKALAVLNAFTHERQLSPQISDAFYLLADVYIQLGVPQEAYKSLERLEAIGAATTDKKTLYTRQGAILEAVGLTDDAVAKYRMAAKNGANPGITRLKIADALLEAGRTQQCLDELAKPQPASWPSETKFGLFEVKARALMEHGKYAEARETIHTAIALRSGRENFSLLASLMQANLALQDDVAAAKIYELTFKLIDTDDPSTEAPIDAQRIILDWARRLYDKGEYARAAEAYSRVVTPRFTVADAAWALFQQGNCSYHMADYEQAGRLYSLLTDQFADSEFVRLAAMRKELLLADAGT